MSDLLKQSLLAVLMMSSGFLTVTTLLVLAWLSKRPNGYWLRIMLAGQCLYNSALSLLLVITFIGIRSTSFGDWFFAVYILCHVLNSVGAFAFTLYLLGILESPHKLPIEKELQPRPREERP